MLSDDARQVLLDDQQLQALRDAGAALVRVDFRLGQHPAWDEAILSQYDRVVQSLAGAGIAVLGLAAHGIVANPQQAQWSAANAEIDRGNGHNPFIDSYVAALRTLATRFHGRVQLWELWNEPNAWMRQERQGAATAYSGGSYIYPSNYAALLARAYAALKGEARLLTSRSSPAAYWATITAAPRRRAIRARRTSRLSTRPESTARPDGRMYGDRSARTHSTP